MDNIWIIDHYASEPQYGAYARQYNFAVGLSKIGYNVTVFTSSYSHFTHRFYDYKKEFTNEINQNARFVYIKTLGYNSNSSPNRIIGMIQIKNYIICNATRFAKEYGIPKYVVGSSPHPFVWQAAERVSKKYNAKFLAEVRDFWPLELRSGDENVLLDVFYSYLERIERKAFKTADRIICTVPYGDLYVCDEKNIDREKYICIGQPLDCVQFDISANANMDNIPEEILTFSKEKFLCIFTGYYMTYEGVYQMLEAANELRDLYPDIGFLFCGSGMEEEGMKRFAEEHGLTNVLVYGRVNKELIPSLLRMSDVCLAYLVDDSGKEMFKYGLSKNKLNEYMYSGRPIIMGYDYPNNEINDAECGYTFYTKENSFARYIKEIYEMPVEDRIHFGINGMEFMKKKHDLSILTNEYANMLKCLM